ncbi:hypothetical protein [Pedobacter metabolipauper]|uniref:Uncharacterized protein n=1 Tax=Pedobacter metabolipauper TaxID=425513 RepID=A0A4R6SZ96_9SPHI|nr:hypothetical protein [Pedobacter metabolipauper]TDQ11392.1 hypothetical protein ATK78_0510 [Pedobacter metabolipauper]
MENQDKNNLHNQEDVNPGSALDKLVKDTDADDLPDTNGTGSNRPVPTSGSVIITDSDADDVEADDTDEEA